MSDARFAARRLGPGLLFAGLVILVWSDPLFFRRNFTGRDLLPYNLPMEKTVHDAYARGRLPVWSPDISGGRPLLPNPNAGALYPVRPLLALLPFPVAMRVYPVLHWTAGGVGMLAFLSTIGLSTGAGWIGAVTYVFSGVSISDVFFPHIQPGMTLLPWILFAVAKRPLARQRRLLLLGALFALDLLAADVFTAGLAMLAAALWLALEVDRSEQLREFGLLAGAVLLGVLVAAPQIVATALWIPETNRAVLGMKLAEVTLYSISPWRLLELVVPYPFGPTFRLKPREVWAWTVYNQKALGLFVTLYAGALAPIALVRAWREKRRGSAFARAMLLFGGIVSIVPSLLPRAWGRLSSPLPLRNPEKLAVAIVLALAMFAARGYESYRERRPGRWALGVGVVLAALALICAAAPEAAGGWATRLVEGQTTAMASVASTALPSALAWGGLLWMATLFGLEAARGTGHGAVLLSLGLLTAVPILASHPIAEISGEQEAFAPTAFARRVVRADPHGTFRALGEAIYRPADTADPLYELSDLARGEEPRRAWTEYTHSFWGYGTVFNNDFDSGDFARLESLRRVSGLAARFPDSGAFFGNVCLRWGIRMRGQPPVSDYRPVGGDAVLAWDELRPAYPDVRLATAWKEKTGSLDALGAIEQMGPGELLLETGRPGSGSARPGRIRILEKSPDRLRLETECADATWLFVLRDFWIHRSIRLDGQPVEAVPAYLAFSAVALPAGRHTIDWRERVPGLPISRFGPILAGIVFVLVILSDRRRRPR